MNNVKLGTIVKDSITGFTGVVIARTEWLHGCVRLNVQPKELKDGVPIESQVFDELQVEEIQETPYSRTGAEIGGPQDDVKALSR